MTSWLLRAKGVCAFALALLASTILSATASEAQERRCQDLGADCDCSETLDTPSPFFALTTPGSGGCAAPYCLNPVSGSTGDLQCGSSTGKFLDQNHNPATFWSVVPEQGMPSANSVTNVWRVNSYGVDVGNGRTDKIDANTRRVCQRIYVKFSSDFSPWPSCNNKVMEMTWGGIQLQSSTSAGSSQIMINALGANHIPGPDTITPAQCVNTWCRVEMCASGNIKAGTNLSSDFHVDTADGNLSSSTSFSIGNGSSGFGHIWPLNLYREPTQGACNGTRQYSHVMQASWNTNAGQTIGPAFEIESGGAGGSGNNPAPTPPTAPVMLP